MAAEIQGMTPLLQVFDMQTSLKFYCEILGFSVLQTDTNTTTPKDWVWMKWNDTDLMLNTAYEADERPPAPDPSRIAAHNDTRLYFGAPDVDAMYADLRAKGVALQAPTTAPYGMKQLFLQDPDGFGLCFQWKARS